MTKALILLLWCLCYFVLGCNTRNPTPDNYKYFNSVSKEQYQRSQAEIKDSIETLIKGKHDPFQPTENDSLTEIYIDTILYGPNKDKYASFIITGNSNDKLIDKGKKEEYHYNAFCFIGKLTTDSTIKDLTWVNAHSLVRYKSLKEVSFRIREIYFKEITMRTNLEDKSTFKYNFDDSRFWDGPIWHKYYQ